MTLESGCGMSSHLVVLWVSTCRARELRDKAVTSSRGTYMQTKETTNKSVTAGQVARYLAVCLLRQALRFGRAALTGPVA